MSKRRIYFLSFGLNYEKKKIKKKSSYCCSRRRVLFRLFCHRWILVFSPCFDPCGRTIEDFLPPMWLNLLKQLKNLTFRLPKNFTTECILIGYSSERWRININHVGYNYYHFIIIIVIYCSKNFYILFEWAAFLKNLIGKGKISLSALSQLSRSRKVYFAWIISCIESLAIFFWK